MGLRVENISAVILAAGRSERMGMPKFMLRHPDGSTFLERSVGRYRAFGCANIVVVVNSEAISYASDYFNRNFQEITLVINEHPERGRYHSLRLALCAIGDSGSVFMGNIDNPGPTVKLLEQLVCHSGTADYLYPQFRGRGGHPVLLSERVVNDIRNQPQDNRNLREVLGGYSRKPVAIDDSQILLNINTLTDYRAYLNGK